MIPKTAGYIYKNCACVILLAAFSLSTYAQAHKALCGNQTAKLPGTIKIIPSRPNISGVSRLSNDPITFCQLPVVFHFVLSKAMLNDLQSQKPVGEILDSQIAEINSDFSGENADSTNIPAAFKPFFGNTSIKFGLAHLDQNGDYTPGYDMTYTVSEGFNVVGGYGSGLLCSAVKYTNSNGTDGWNQGLYLNVWVANLLENNSPTSILGATVPQYFTEEYTNIPSAEVGIVISYQELRDGHYKTLTHELGHFLGLLHVFGYGNGLCPWDGGGDDGISDTPPQDYPTYGCPAFPVLDSCTPDGNGVMFVNYMDYSNNSCKLMFTVKQCELMDTYVVPGGDLYTLTQHPYLLSSSWQADASLSCFPNPTKGIVSISFKNPIMELANVYVYNSAGRAVKEINNSYLGKFYSIDLSGQPKGVYIVKIICSKLSVFKITLI